jgi:hypothetical protein
MLLSSQLCKKRTEVQTNLGINVKPCSKVTKAERAAFFLLEYLPNKYKSLSSKRQRTQNVAHWYTGSSDDPQTGVRRGDGQLKDLSNPVVQRIKRRLWRIE